MAPSHSEQAQQEVQHGTHGDGEQQRRQASQSVGEEDEHDASLPAVEERNQPRGYRAAMSDDERPWEPPLAGTEVEHLVGALNRLRTTFRWKADGLDAVGLQVRI